MRISQSNQIIIASILGIGIGCLLNSFGPALPLTVKTLYVADLIGGIFINLLKMILIPLIFTSIAVGIGNLRAHAQIGRVWKITLIYFLSSTSIAIILGLICVNVFKPGLGVHIDFLQSAAQINVETLSFGQFVRNFFFSLFMNPIKAMAESQVLPTVIFAVFLGIAMIQAGKRTERIFSFLSEFLDLIMIIVSWIMRLAPIGIMALLIKLFGTQNLEVLKSVGAFVLLVYGATIVHGFVILPLILYIFGRCSYRHFFSSMKEALITAFSTSSSNATLPVTMACVENNLKVDKNIASFVLPVGATLNMDGTALYEAMAAIFVANIIGIDLNLIQQVIIFIIAMVASIGAPGIPSAGMVTMIMVLQSVGLPAEAIAILLPVDRFLDTIRTLVNVEGDAVCSVIVQRHTVRT